MTVPKTFTVKEVAEMVDRTPTTVRRWISSGYIPASRIGREYRISASDLNAWYKSRGGHRLVKAGSETIAEFDLEEPENLEDVRQVAGSVGELAEDLRDLADDLEAWSQKLTDATDVDVPTDDEEEPDDQWTEDMFEDPEEGEG